MRWEPESKQKPELQSMFSRIARIEHTPPQYQAYIEAYQHHTKLSCNVPPFLTLHSDKKDPNIDSEHTPSCSDTPSIRSCSLSDVLRCGKDGSTARKSLNHHANPGAHWSTQNSMRQSFYYYLIRRNSWAKKSAYRYTFLRPKKKDVDTRISASDKTYFGSLSWRK
jgi:hypothetical protein